MSKRIQIENELYVFQEEAEYLTGLSRYSLSLMVSKGLIDKYKQGKHNLYRLSQLSNTITKTTNK